MSHHENTEGHAVRGFHQVNERTTLITENGVPVEVRSTARDLDRAFEAAEQFYGAPLDCGSWEAIVSTPKGERNVWCVRVEPMERTL